MMNIIKINYFDTLDNDNKIKQYYYGIIDVDDIKYHMIKTNYGLLMKIEDYLLKINKCNQIMKITKCENSNFTYLSKNNIEKIILNEFLDKLIKNLKY